jgi:hypothetical protein
MALFSPSTPYACPIVRTIGIAQSLPKPALWPGAQNGGTEAFVSGRRFSSKY